MGAYRRARTSSSNRVDCATDDDTEARALRCDVGVCAARGTLQISRLAGVLRDRDGMESYLYSPV